MAPGVIIAPRWMSSTSLNRASAQWIATRSSRAASRPAEGEQRPALGGAGRRDPGADGVGHVQPHRRARMLVGRVAGDEGAEPFECAHGLRPVAPPPSTAGTITHRLQPVPQSSSGAGLVTVLVLLRCWFWPANYD